MANGILRILCVAITAEEKELRRSEGDPLFESAQFVHYRFGGELQTLHQLLFGMFRKFFFDSFDYSADVRSWSTTQYCIGTLME